MGRVACAKGKEWGVRDPAVNVGGQDRAGIAYFVLNPHSKKIVVQGQAGIANTDLTYPAVGGTQSGRGVIAFTLTRDKDYPSAALAGGGAQKGQGGAACVPRGARAPGGLPPHRELRPVGPPP